jgi:AcrR family transcriptional regulator
MPYPAKINREKVLKHGLRILERDGIEALSLRAIARKLKVAVNAIYNYFPSRRALESAIAAEGYKILRLKLVGASAGAPAKARLLALCKTYLRFARTHQRLFELMSRKRPPRSDLSAINSELTSLIMNVRGRKLDGAHVAKEAFMVHAMLHGIIAAEQQMRSHMPATYTDFAFAAVISEITRAREFKRPPRQSSVCRPIVC